MEITYQEKKLIDESFEGFTGETTYESYLYGIGVGLALAQVRERSR